MTGPTGAGRAEGLSFSPDDSVSTALSKMSRALVDAGIEDAASAQRDARFLLQGVLGVDGASLLTAPERPLGGKASALVDAAHRRLRHEPISRILGSREFYGREFVVTPDVLDPRPDTEAVVDLAMAFCAEAGFIERPVRIADIGTGSGILIGTLLAELPLATGIATDVSAPALAVAERNAERLGVSDRCTFVLTSGLDGRDETFDLIVSNPPYIPSGDIATLGAEVRDFDPVVALDGGRDGLNIYREFARGLVPRLRQGCLIVEFGSGQDADIERIFSECGWRVKTWKRDLGGHIRAVALEIHP
ncbi:peptide chain release factor N(5)-glutamine methyltransferase [Hyphomicrobium methylovorum]|uniref:peptide chain release factor N(5)-glutamine methyltransferase n=1 Tax=Hyphomicrobium methylovorum TaxID=84 RepID=UPI0015E6648C|nr:peptide chain release factor N(5)-glutamine methyltransferase [Hyphomicrobium methylovorum]MBA2126418.1 peptide chain release factor N(5)-glutamine methyltransferase [Hyphomicrobium methylovorum]